MCKMALRSWRHNFKSGLSLSSFEFVFNVKFVLDNYQYDWINKVQLELELELETTNLKHHQSELKSHDNRTYYRID